MKKIISLLLVLCMVLGVLSACNVDINIGSNNQGSNQSGNDQGSNNQGGGNNQGGSNQGGGNQGGGNDQGGGNQGGGNDQGGDRVGDGWEDVDFGGQEVKFCISVNKYDECTFPAADIYTKGPDQAGSNAIAKEVIARNTAAAETLNISIAYSTKDLTYDNIHEDIRNIVQTSATNSPDIYNNDIFGLARAMVDGLLWNVKDPGVDVRNYFDFEREGWYHEFIKGCTFDQEKLYLFAGDYFIDMIRMAWVVYVNHDLFKANLGKMPYWCTSVKEFYEYVEDGFWDLDVITEMSRLIFVEHAGGQWGVTEYHDCIVGLALNPAVSWYMSSASDVTLYYQDKADNYKPSVMQSIKDYQKVSNKYVELLNTHGVYHDDLVIDSTNRFLQGNFLFAFSRLGEMESLGLRDFPAAKGLVPMPKWDASKQDDYHTPVHDQAEIGCILNTAQSFSAASALMQYLNEESDAVVYEYYEKGLKYKYNDDANAREMMDLVRETTASPFDSVIGSMCLQLYPYSSILTGLSVKNSSTISSTYASEKDAYIYCMNLMLEKFAKLK